MKNAKPPLESARTGKKRSGPSNELKIKITPWSDEQKVIEAAAHLALSQPAAQKALGRARRRLLSVRMIEPEPEVKTGKVPPASNRYRATIYDYSSNRTLLVHGEVGSRSKPVITESGVQPLPSREEFDAAVKILAKDAELGSALREKRVRPYRPMPPLVNAEQRDGSTERILAVGLLPTDGGVPHEIVGVNMGRQSVVRFEGRAPAMALAKDTTCGVPDAGQATAQHIAGQAVITVSQGSTTLWKFHVVRPAASSGTNGSGVELRYVDYRGKRVLYRAHVPILNVKYDNDACGPYRDWQNEESMIEAAGADVVPGFRLCPTPATTVLDTGSDAGNYLGAAIYVEGQEVVLVSEMEAGWYRYISQWRLHADGTIRPRFGFAAVDSSSCVCNRHHHHVYWRFDFDLRTPGNNLVREFNDPPLAGGSNWHLLRYEVKRPRNPAHKRKWRIENSATGEAYDVVPGPEDGIATTSPDWPFPRGDVWVLRYRPSQIDDGVVATGPPYEVGIDSFVNHEPIHNQDLVIWYAGHVTHHIAVDPPGTFGHIVGPDLMPVKW